ncbi:MAG: precorrin-8X methylmutase [Enterocloster sp.]
MEWTETLCRETGIRFLTTRPSEIESASFAIIKEELGEEFLKTCPKDQLPVLCRVIHTTADFSYKENLYFSEDAVSKAREALASGIPIITDTTMAASGSIKRLPLLMASRSAAHQGRDVKGRQESGITRSAVSVDKAARLYPDCIYAVGNAPRRCGCMKDPRQEIRPRLVVGVPVGFVNVVEAKELILSAGVPCIVARGRKGGSNVAAAICNALLYDRKI